MGLKNLLNRIKEIKEPILRDIKGNILNDAGWYLKTDLDEIALPCYFTGEFSIDEGLGYAIFENIKKYDEGAFIIWCPNFHTTQLAPIKNPQKYLGSLKQKIDKKSKLPIKQLSKANLPLLRKSAEWMERKLEQLA